MILIPRFHSRTWHPSVWAADPANLGKRGRAYTPERPRRSVPLVKEGRRWLSSCLFLVVCWFSRVFRFLTWVFSGGIVFALVFSFSLGFLCVFFFFSPFFFFFS